MKVVICDHIFPGLEQEKKAFSCIPDLQLIDAHCTSKEEVIAACADADAVLNQYNFFTEEVINSFQNCKVISTYGIGLDKIDVDAATKRGIFVCNSPDYNKEEVANHTVALVAALSRHLMEFDRRMRRGQYATPFEEMKPGRPSQQTMGFVGFGKIGRQTAAKLQGAFGMRVICYDPYLSAEQVASFNAEKVDLETVMRDSDYISINVSLAKDTRYLIDEPQLRLMKPTAFIINCARGGIIRESALLKVLQERRIAGAALDTFETEPMPKDHPLLTLDNVITTPHAAWYTTDAMKELTWCTAQQAALVLTGQVPTHCVNYDAVMKLRNQ